MNPSPSSPPPTEEEALETEELEDAAKPQSPAPTLTAPADARHRTEQAVPEAVAHQISPVSLGIGMALMGLGIGFLGVRMRRR
ncbi:hypothetical protein [Streptomyces sp. NPDC020681]|uniref:hypothetical protein n=1 Tax=Streptomyces sp. NPDC020681 TaxID=3365083 RepID=UPI003796444F